MQEAMNAESLDHGKLSYLKLLVIGWLCVAGISSIIERLVYVSSLPLPAFIDERMYQT